MKRDVRKKLNGVNEELKKQYHVLGTGSFMQETGKGYKLNRAFLLLDLAICEINEALGKGRND